jgi:hypothetical protein
MDSGYQGAQFHHVNTRLPSKRSKNHPLSQDQRQTNRTLSQQRVSNEHAIGFLKRFDLRFNLIAGLCNSELAPNETG